VLFVSIVILSNERLLNCDALRTFLRPGWKVWVSVGLKTTQYQGFSERYLLIHFIKFEPIFFK